MHIRSIEAFQQFKNRASLPQFESLLSQMDQLALLALEEEVACFFAEQMPEPDAQALFEEHEAALYEALACC